MPHPRFSIPQILSWVDSYYARTGTWPKKTSGLVPEAVGVNWRMVDNALLFGLRGLEGNSSLAKVLQHHRGVRHKHNLPLLTEDLILTWADLHRDRTGAWPNENSGPVLDAPGEVWVNIDASLRDGFRGLPGGSSLGRVLAEHRGVRRRGRPE